MQNLHRDDDGTRRMSGVVVRDGVRSPEEIGSELTASEQLIWTGQRLDPASPLYNMALGLEIATAIDVPAFLVAFQRLVDETDALRTSFVEVEGLPRRVVRHNAPGRVDLLCLSDDDVDDRAFVAMLEARTRRSVAMNRRLSGTSCPSAST